MVSNFLMKVDHTLFLRPHKKLGQIIKFQTITAVQSLKTAIINQFAT